jgi:hypothetical protein
MCPDHFVELSNVVAPPVVDPVLEEEEEPEPPAAGNDLNTWKYIQSIWRFNTFFVSCDL